MTVVLIDIGEGLEVDTSTQSSSSLPHDPSSNTVSEDGDEQQSPPHSRQESEEETEGEEGEGVGQLLRATVGELEGALQDTRQLLAARDKELSQLKNELDRYRQQAAREIANKTRLAQALDQSQSHTSQLEGLLQKWQFEVPNQYYWTTAKYEGECYSIIQFFQPGRDRINMSG